MKVNELQNQPKPKGIQTLTYKLKDILAQIEELEKTDEIHKEDIDKVDSLKKYVKWVVKKDDEGV